MMNIYSQISKNKRTTSFIVAGFIAFFLLIGLGIDRYYGAGMNVPVFTLIALAAGGTLSFASYWAGDKLVLSSTRARGLNPEDLKEKQWQNIIEEMSIASGIPLPKTYVIDDPDPNAFATGRDPKHASIAVTRGLIDTLNRDELQAVAAHEMSHIKNYDIRLMLMIAVLIGSIALLSDWAGRGLFRGRRGDSRGRQTEGGVALIIFVIWLVAVILAPIMSQMMAMCVSRRREYLADAGGAELTRNPLALVSALEKISARPEPTRSINRGTAHLCICDPKGSAINSKEGRFADLFATHPPIGKRIEALKAMAYVGG